MKQTGISFWSILSIMLLMSACKEESSSYNGHEYVDLGLSVKWATCNVGADKPEGFGDYFAWGEIRSKLTYTWKGYRFRASGNSYSEIKFSKYGTEEFSVIQKKSIPKNEVLEPADDVANLEWGGNWRMPTKEEIEELVRNCDWVGTTQNGVNGVRITSKVEGYTDRSIFIPTTGYKDDSKQIHAGEAGYLWSCTNSKYKDRAYVLSFNSHGSFLDSRIRDYIDEDWHFNDTEGNDNFGGLPQSLADKLIKYFESGKVNLDSIPQSIYDEYRTYITTVDSDIVPTHPRFLGMQVRPVCP